MVKSETTVRRELKEIWRLLEGGELTSDTVELMAVKATLQWILGNPNVHHHGIPKPKRPKECRRPSVWVTDRWGGTVD